MPPYFVSFRVEIRMEENLPPFTAIEDPGIIDLLRKATGVLLPSHVSPWIYRSIIQHAKNWFPRLEARFDFQGKTRQQYVALFIAARRTDYVLLWTGWRAPDRSH